MVQVKIHLFACECSDVLTPFVENGILAPLHCVYSFVKNQGTILKVLFLVSLDNNTQF